MALRNGGSAIRTHQPFFFVSARGLSRVWNCLAALPFWSDLLWDKSRLIRGPHVHANYCWVQGIWSGKDGWSLFLYDDSRCSVSVPVVDDWSRLDLVLVDVRCRDPYQRTTRSDIGGG